MNMDVFVFVYHVKPTEGSPEYGKVGGAHVDIWVHETSRASAETKALSYLIDAAWQIVEAEDELVLNDEQILYYREDAQASYRQAKMRGLSAFFSAYPPEDREDGLVEMRPLKSPPKGSSTKH